MSYAERTSLQVAIVPLTVGDQSSETAAEYCSELADITTAKNEHHLCKWKKNSFSFPFLPFYGRILLEVRALHKSPGKNCKI